MKLSKYFPKKVETKKDREITLRLPKLGDHIEMQRFINDLVIEDVPILKNEKIGIADEKKYLDGLLKDIKNKKTINIFAFNNKKLIANTSVKAGIFKSKHIGNLGISIDKNFRNEGLGYLLMKEVLCLAENHLKLKKVTLAVMESNLNGINLYLKTGFKEYGRLPGALYYRGKYVNEILMYKAFDNTIHP